MSYFDSSITKRTKDMTTATHFRLGILSVISFDSELITCIVNGEEKKYLNDPTKIYINDSGINSFEKFVSTEEKVLQVLLDMGVNVDRIDRSKKSESVYIYVGIHKIRISSHRDYSVSAITSIQIETGFSKNDILNKLKNLWN